VARKRVYERLEIRMVATVDFRHGMPSHYEALKKRRLMDDITDEETIVLISLTGLQVAFLMQAFTLEARDGEPVNAIHHRRVQLDRRTPFNRSMLSKYAERAGIELVHIERFEDHIRGAAA
jgi:hypothetical protein